MKAVTTYARLSSRELADSLPTNPADVEAIRLDAKAICHKLSIAQWTSAVLLVAAFAGVAIWKNQDQWSPEFYMGLALVCMGVGVITSIFSAALFDGVLADKYSVLQRRLTPLCDSTFYMERAVVMIRKCPSALAYRNRCIEKGRQLYFVDSNVIEELLEEERQTILDAERKALCQQLHNEDLSAASAPQES